MKITKRQLRKLVREAGGDTGKYDSDSALKGDQDKLPDGLQKAIIDKTVDDREEHEEEERQEKNESVRVTRRQLRNIIRESISSDRIYLDDDVSYSFGLDYDNTGHEWTIYPDDFKKMQRMNQYDAAHQKIFAKHITNHSTKAVGAGYGWWELEG